MKTGVYLITNNANGKVYVGSSTNIGIRHKRHLTALRKGTHHSIKLQRAWLKYGEESFVFRTLLICNRDTLLAYEQRALDTYDAVKKGYNVLSIAGSSLGLKHKEETKRKLSEMFKGSKRGVGIPCSEEKKIKISNANRGKVKTEETLVKLRLARKGRKPSLGMKHTEESKNKMSEARKGKKPSPESIAIGAAKRKGLKLSSEAREKISKAAKARKRKPHSEETKKKISLAHKGKIKKPHSEETKRKISIAAIKRYAKINPHQSNKEQ